MHTITDISITKATQQRRQAIIDLLTEEHLPTADLPFSLDHFFVAAENDKVIAAIGLEQYADCGLLRSMVVHKAYRNQHIAAKLVKAVEELAKASGISCMYLLTETAALYFEKKGYQKISRSDAPETIRASSEFSSVCPVSATVMKKQLA